MIDVQGNYIHKNSQFVKPWSKPYCWVFFQVLGAVSASSLSPQKEWGKLESEWQQQLCSHFCIFPKMVSQPEIPSPVCSICLTVMLGKPPNSTHSALPLPWTLLASHLRVWWCLYVHGFRASFQAPAASCTMLCTWGEVGAAVSIQESSASLPTWEEPSCEGAVGQTHGQVSKNHVIVLWL